jgi:TatD DNase family protein
MKDWFFDAHSHAHFPAYGDESVAVVQRALDAGVQMILVGTERGTSESAIALAEQFEGVWAAVGLHPTHTTPAEYVDEKELADVGFTYEPEVFDVAHYTQLAQHPKVVAIGECGLDYFRLDPETARVQKEALVAQMAVAKAVNKPITIHCRNAFPDLIEVFKGHKDLLLDKPGTIHFFTGTLEEAKVLLDMGFYLQFGGVITFAKMYEEIVRAIPLERIITETDAPYVAPVPHRGKRNEPAYVVEVVKKIAEIKGIGLEEVRKQVRENVRAVFGV